MDDAADSAGMDDAADPTGMDDIGGDDSDGAAGAGADDNISAIENDDDATWTDDPGSDADANRDPDGIGARGSIVLSVSFE
jgi:hypothetical protein